MGHRPDHAHAGKGDELARKPVGERHHDARAFHIRVPGDTRADSIGRPFREDVEMLAITGDQILEFFDILQQD